jgi:hypothetical protein
MTLLKGMGYAVAQGRLYAVVQWNFFAIAKEKALYVIAQGRAVCHCSWEGCMLFLNQGDAVCHCSSEGCMPLLMGRVYAIGLLNGKFNANA